MLGQFGYSSGQLIVLLSDPPLAYTPLIFSIQIDFTRSRFRSTQSNNMNQTTTRTSCRWKSTPSSQSIPSIPIRTHDQRWNSCQRGTTITTDTPPLIPRRSEDPIDWSLACNRFLSSKTGVGRKAPKRVVPAALLERTRSQRKF
jgi:hypothetical protein